MQTVSVQTQTPYDVLIGYGLLSGLGEALRARHGPCQVVLVSEEGIYARYGDAARLSLKAAGFLVTTCLVNGGENNKTPDTLIALMQRYAQAGVTAQDLVVALGGGVLGDLAGLSAALYLRGIGYVQVPTTLLAAADASVGGKTGVNLPQGKNLAGVYWQPLMVLCDCDTLTSLPRADYLDGVATCLKYGVLRDRALFERVASGALEADLPGTIARCVQIKASLVAEDERETAGRQLLNFGSPMTYAIEQLSGYSISYGRALAMGMVGMAHIAQALNVCAMGSAGILMAMLDRLGLPCETGFTAEEMARAALGDRKRSQDRIALVLPESIGRCVLHTVALGELPRMFRLAKGERA